MKPNLHQQHLFSAVNTIHTAWTRVLSTFHVHLVYHTCSILSTCSRRSGCIHMVTTRCVAIATG